jgi:DNA-binding NarL/FixJ family response regulator
MRILCAENSPVTFRGISALLSTEGYSSLLWAKTVAEIRTALASEPFDLLITELRFADGEFLDLADDFCASYPSLSILVYTQQDNPTYLARASASKLFDYVLKNMDTACLLRAIASVPTKTPTAESLLTMSTKFLGMSMHPSNPNTDHLTKRELQILTHLALGLSNKEISHTLGISLETVKEHVQNVLRKLKASDRTEAAVWALKNGVPTIQLPNR